MAEPLATPEVIWRAYPGSQSEFLRCPALEVLYEGERGPGKTDALLMSFARYVNNGFGKAWRGVIFRRTYPELSELVIRSKELFPRLFPGARFVGSGPLGYTWNFPDGEILRFRQLPNMDAARLYLGHQYPFIGFEELTTWPTQNPYEALLACARSVTPGIPLRVRSNTNPWGPGMGWVKQRFIDPMPEGVILNSTFEHPQTGEKLVLTRCRIHGRMAENLMLMKNNPAYVAQIMAIKDPVLRAAWLEGSWDIRVGGFYADRWDEQFNVIEPFKIPASWKVDRAYDYGSAKPYSVGWFAESDGSELDEPVMVGKREVRTFPNGSLFRIHELYGWNGNPNEGCRASVVEVAKDIKEHEEGLRGHVLNGHAVLPGPADTSIFDPGDDGKDLASKMAAYGVYWTKAIKRPGTRVIRWKLLGDMMTAAKAWPLEEPGFWAFSTCRHFIRTVSLAGTSEKNPDDIDSDCEDHALDEVGYRVLARAGGIEFSSGRI